MIRIMSVVETIYQDSLYRFEVETPDISCTISLTLASKFMELFCRNAIVAHKDRLAVCAVDGSCHELHGVKFVGAHNYRLRTIFFRVDDIHALIKVHVCRAKNFLG